MNQDLRELARFLPVFESPDFKAGEMVGAKEAEPGIATMPYVRYGDIAMEFVRAANRHGWVVPGFDWGEWKQSAEAKALRDDDARLAHATPEQLARLLTVVIRQERFAEGVLLDAFESGMILRIVRRAAQLLQSPEDPSER